MPKIKKNLNQVKYVSVADMYKNLDEIKSIDDKLAYATRYILNHDMSTTKDYSLSGAVHLARAKIAEAVKKSGAKLNREEFDKLVDSIQAKFMKGKSVAEEAVSIDD